MKVWITAILLLANVKISAAELTSSPPVLTSARFEQVALTVADIDVARSFYGDKMGLRLMFESNTMLFFDVGGTRLMIARSTDRKRRLRPDNILYFHVDDFVAALKRLQQTGTPLIGMVETVQSGHAGALQLQQFEDPDGNMLAIMGFVPR